VIVLRPPGYYSYFDPGLIHTEFGFASVAYAIADDATIQAGLVFKEEGLADLAARALDIFYAVDVEYCGANVALAVYQAISERMPTEVFTWSVEGLEDILRSWPTPTPVERAKAAPEEREVLPEELWKMPREEGSPELVPIVPRRRPPVVAPPKEEGPPPVEFIPLGEPGVLPLPSPMIPRPPEAPPEERRPPTVPPVPRIGVPVEKEIPPVEVPGIERPPTVSEVTEEIAEKIGELTGLDYSAIRDIVQEGVDRLSTRLQDPGVVGKVTTEDEIEVDSAWVKEQWKRDFRLTKEAAAEVMEGQEIDERDWTYPVSLPGQE